MGEVCRARDTRLGREVAIKVLSKVHAASPTAASRFEREARLQAALNHPSIAALYDYGEHEDFAFLVLELVDGPTLRDRLSSGPMTVEEARPIFLQVVDALAAAHERGIVHRDLKPANVKLNPEGRVKLLDFGLAKRIFSFDRDSETLLEGDELTGAQLVGTPSYMSPEQLRGEKVVERSDIWAFGCVLFEALSGRRAFHGKSRAEQIAATLTGAPDMELIAAAPLGWRQLVARCLERDPDRRFESIRDAAPILSQAGDAATLDWKVPAPPDNGPASPATTRRSLAVLPFVNLSSDEDDEYFSDGLTEEIMSALSRLPHLMVVARSSAFAFKGRQVDVREVAEILNVGYVLEGSVRKSGTRVRVGVQMIDASDGSCLWSERFDRELADIFALQDEITGAVVHSFHEHSGSFTGDVVEASSAKPASVDLEAYLLVMKARFAASSLSGDGFLQAIQLYHAALARDPSSAAALGGLAEGYLAFGFYGVMDSRDALGQARDLSLRALSIAPEDPRALVVLASVKEILEWDLAGGYNAYRKAIASSPSFAIGHYSLSQSLSRRGRHEAAIATAERAHALDPLSPLMVAGLAQVRYEAGQEEDALRLLQESEGLHPGNPIVALTLGVILRDLGRYPEALPHFEASVDMPGDFGLASLGNLLARMQRQEEAEKILEQLDSHARNQGTRHLEKALVLTGLGRAEQALDELDASAENREGRLLMAATMRAFHPLQHDPRFQTLLRRIGLPAA